METENKKHGIDRISDRLGGRWCVESLGDSTYTVQSRMSDGRVFQVSCNCPAREKCRHIEAVMELHYPRELESCRSGLWGDCSNLVGDCTVYRQSENASGC